MSKLSESQKQFVDAVAIWLKTQLEKNSDTKTSEIELRFGHLQSLDGGSGGNFVNGVNINSWHHVREALAHCEIEAQSKPPESVLEIVKIYESGVKSCNLRVIEHADGSKTSQCKINLAQKNFRILNQQQQISVRLSHSVETPQEIDQTQAPVLIRGRARTTFWHRMWRIDISQIQQGGDEDAVEMAPALYEVEIELLRDNIDWSKHDYHYVALSLLVKIGEILNFMSDLPNDDMVLPEMKE